jgi:hypothetical protein
MGPCQQRLYLNIPLHSVMSSQHIGPYHQHHHDTTTTSFTIIMVTGPSTHGPSPQSVHLRTSPRSRGYDMSVILKLKPPTKSIAIDFVSHLNAEFGALMLHCIQQAFKVNLRLMYP